MQTIPASNLASVLQHNRYPLKILALGDSLIYGFGDPDGGGWVERLRRQWLCSTSSTHALYNLGIRGDGVAGVSQRLEQEFRRRGELKNQYPNLIILSVGVNDSARLGRPGGRLFTDFEKFQVEINYLLDKARQLSSVIFIGMVPVDEAKMPFLDCFYFNHIDQYRYKEVTKQACQARQIPYLDIFDLWLRRDKNWVRSCLSPDGLHPNVEGYQALLKDILSWELPFNDFERVLTLNSR